MDAEAKLREMGLELPPAPHPVANYVPAVQVGNLLFVSGHGPARGGAFPAKGKLGRELTVEQGYQAAQAVALNMLSTVKATMGSLDRVRRVVKLLGMVNSAEGFSQQPAVINGASDLLVAVFGEAGRHARSAVGMAELPMGIPVEIEMILEVAE